MWVKQFEAIRRGQATASVHGPFPYCFSNLNVSPSDPTGARANKAGEAKKRAAPRGGVGRVVKKTKDGDSADNSINEEDEVVPHEWVEAAKDMAIMASCREFERYFSFHHRFLLQSVGSVFYKCISLPNKACASLRRSCTVWLTHVFTCLQSNGERPWRELHFEMGYSSHTAENEAGRYRAVQCSPPGLWNGMQAASHILCRLVCYSR